MSRPTSSDAALRPVAEHPAEALRLLEAARYEAAADGVEVEAAYASQLAASVREGRLDGRLWVGPKDEAIALALWATPGDLGRSVAIYLAPEAGRTSAVTGFLGRLEGGPEGPVRRIDRLGARRGAAEFAAALPALGFVALERVDLKLPPGRDVPPGTPDLERRLRPLGPDDEAAVARLIGRAYADMPLERALFAKIADPEADARAGAAQLFRELGRWWSDASFGIDAPGGLAAATLVNDHLGPLLTEVMTDPDFRGRGYAPALIARSVGAVRRRTATPLRLVVTWSNERARALYLRLGFEPDEATRGTVWVRPLPAP